MTAKMNRSDALKLMALGGTALGAPAWLRAMDRTPNADQPNILFIMSDDHAANAIGAYNSWLGDVINTPNIDRLASEGLRLDNCFCTNSICTPSRASIMTGQYSHANGVRTLDQPLDSSKKTVAHHMQQAGYETAIIGKWHLHGDPTGFDHWNIVTGKLGQGFYFDPQMKNERGEERKVPGYATDVITDDALNWLKGRKSDKPFFLMCQHKAPHGLWEYAPRHEQLLDDIEIPEPPGFWEDKSHRNEASRDFGSNLYKLGQRMNKGSAGSEWPTGRLDTTGMTDKEIKQAGYQKYIRDYLRCIAAIDENVGRMLEYIDESGLAENTVVIYTSDQGQFLGEHDYYDKRWMFEDSQRMPFIIRYPKEIEAGTTEDALIANVDFAPLFLDYAGAKQPQNMQGYSFRSILAGSNTGDWRDAVYYRYWMHMAHHNVPAHYGIRTDRYKLIFYYGLGLGLVGEQTSETMDRDKAEIDHFRPTQPGWELYDLQTDPVELQNVYNDPAYVDIIPRLKEQLLELKADIGDNDEQYPELMAVREKYWN